MVPVPYSRAENQELNTRSGKVCGLLVMVRPLRPPAAP